MFRNSYDTGACAYRQKRLSMRFFCAIGAINPNLRHALRSLRACACVALTALARAARRCDHVVAAGAYPPERMCGCAQRRSRALSWRLAHATRRADAMEAVKQGSACVGCRVRAPAPHADPGARAPQLPTPLSWRSPNLF